MNKKSYICVCGHVQSEHSANFGSPLCNDCANENRGWGEMWHEFKTDNLKYLEKKYEETL